MNRLQQKCLIVSLGLHGLLLSLLVFGPGFLVSPQKQRPVPPPIDFVPLQVINEALAGGGNPQGRLPTSPRPVPNQPERRFTAPPTPRHAPPRPNPPPPRRMTKPQVHREAVKEAPKPESDSLKPAHKWRPRKPQISTQLVTRRDTRAESRRRAERRAREEARRLEAERRRLASSIEQTADAIGSSLSSSSIRIEFKGPGGGGVPYAGFLQAVSSLYDQAWVLPNGVTDRNATAIASVTIARDGTVLEARIIRSSGNPEVDRSVRAALDRVTRTPPFPDGATETERTITINFNAQAKQAM